MSSDSTVLSLGDSLIRESDLNLLSGPHWLNDRVISFYFEYLHLHKFESASGVCFISPEVSQFLKLANFEEIPIFLEPLELERKDVILMAVNNAKDPSGEPSFRKLWSSRLLTKARVLASGIIIFIRLSNS